MDTYTKTMLTIITVCVAVVTLIFIGSLIFENNEDDYGYAEEFHEKLDYIIHRIEELEERIE